MATTIAHLIPERFACRRAVPNVAVPALCCCQPTAGTGLKANIRNDGKLPLCGVVYGDFYCKRGDACRTIVGPNKILFFFLLIGIRVNDNPHFAKRPMPEIRRHNSLCLLIKAQYRKCLLRLVLKHAFLIFIFIFLSLEGKSETWLKVLSYECQVRFALSRHVKIH